MKAIRNSLGHSVARFAMIKDITDSDGVSAASLLMGPRAILNFFNSNLNDSIVKFEQAWDVTQSRGKLDDEKLGIDYGKLMREY